ncbi:MAG: cell division protein ZapE, partial [Betaproteobacteria bacterium]
MTVTSDGEHRDLAVNGVLPAFESIAQAQDFELDDAQREALRAFQRLYDDLLQVERGWRPLARLFGRKRAVQGLYLWGAVGRGKSFLMDAFFRLAPTAEKQRTHFHRFMQDIHRRLHVLQGESNPLDLIAEQVSMSTRLLCLDEFHVNDIGDAMLMSGLLHGLFERGMVLMTTSNQRPDALYEHGLQRVRFLPAIELIKTHMQVVAIDAGSDYRLRALTRAGVYHHPLGASAEAALESGFLAVAGGAGENTGEIEVEGRRIAVRRVAAETAWFDFAALCDGPRGTADYIELA